MKSLLCWVLTHKWKLVNRRYGWIWIMSTTDALVAVQKQAGQKGCWSSLTGLGCSNKEGAHA